MLFKVVMHIMLNTVALCFFPLLALTIPYSLGALGVTGVKAIELNRQRNVFYAHQTHQANLKLYRSL